MWMNPQGTRVAYLLKSPNLAQNYNDYQLYIKDVQDQSLNNGKLLLSGEGISSGPSDVTWLGDGSHLVLLMPIHGIKTLVTVNVNDGTQQTLLESAQDITEYSVDSAGSVLAYSISDQDVGKHSGSTISDEQMASGYLIQARASAGAAYWLSSVFIKRRLPDGTWGSAERVSIEDPFTHEKFDHIHAVSMLSLSPNGKRLALNYWTDANLPEDWKKNPNVQMGLRNQAFQRIMVIKDLQTQNTSLGFKNTYIDSLPLWSRDGKTFLMNAHSPVGTVWEQEDIRDHRTTGLDANLFWVNADSGEVKEVFRHVASHHQGPLFWAENGDIFVEMLGGVNGVGGRIARFQPENGSWHETQGITVPGNGTDQFWWTATNGVAVVGIHQALTTPEDLFVYKPSDKNIHILTDINPQLREVKFANVKSVSWTTPEGLAVDGLLFMPQDYEPGKRYPLVIQTKGDQGQFTCDSGLSHDPSFAPQPTASAGIMYLIRTTKAGFNFQDELEKKPKGYPGGLGMAAQQMSIWDSAVASLDKQGLIDPAKVGIIGWSATGFYVEFILTQSPIKFAAATTADNTSFSLSEYWLGPGIDKPLEDMWGGPPYGKTLENWMKYSFDFNLDRVHTPLLMEMMGYGIHDDYPGSIPSNLAVSYEFLKGLTRLDKPVEMYYYPNEEHAPDNPKARLATLQRNVDWYRFWLQGYERPNPEDPDQYKRWEHLRELRDADARATVQAQASSPNLN
jgi:dipeptidyl aminopeptidase/acylaminoacyl peptidase